MKKFGHVLLSILPMVAALLLTVITSICCQTVLSIIYVAKNGQEGAMEYLTEVITSGDGIMAVTSIAYLIITLIGIPVLCKGLKRKEAYGNPVKAFPGLSFPGIIFLFIGFELACSCIMASVSFINPDALSAYAELVNKSGIAGLTVISTIATLIAAPICEELIFRGLTITILEKGDLNFWVVNFVQALLFGIYHLNLVQGLYAFFFGFVLGIIYKKTKSLWATMLGHFVFNFSGTYIVSALFKNVETWSNLILLAVIAIAALAAGIIAITFNKKEEQ